MFLSVGWAAAQPGWLQIDLKDKWRNLVKLATDPSKQARSVGLTGEQHHAEGGAGMVVLQCAALDSEPEETPTAAAECLLSPRVLPALPAAAEEQRQVIWGIVLSNNGGEMQAAKDGGAVDQEAAEEQEMQQQAGAVHEQEEQEQEAEALPQQQGQQQPDGL